MYIYIYIYILLLLLLLFTCAIPISDSLKTPVLLYFEKESHTINQKSRALSDFLKIIYD